MITGLIEEIEHISKIKDSTEMMLKFVSNCNNVYFIVIDISKLALSKFEGYSHFAAGMHSLVSDLLRSLTRIKLMPS